MTVGSLDDLAQEADTIPRLKQQLLFSVFDFLLACLFTFGSVMFMPEYQEDPSKMLLGLNTFSSGIAAYIVLTGAGVRDVLTSIGWKSMQFAEMICSIFGLALFLSGLVLFYPANTLPKWMVAARRPFVALCSVIAPEYLTHLPGSDNKDPGPQGFPLTAAMFFLVGSIFFCFTPIFSALSMSNEGLKHQTRAVVNLIIKVLAGVLFAMGSMFFIPGLSCDYGAMGLGSYLFIIASTGFVVTAISDTTAAAMALHEARKASPYSTLPTSITSRPLKE